MADKAIYAPDEESQRKYQEAHDRVTASLDARKNRLFDPTLLAMAEGFLAPTRTGGFGESLGIAAGKVRSAEEDKLYTMALYLAGMRSIPGELKEAARIDGASEFQIYRRIMLPLLAPVTLSALIILGHMSLKVFDLIVAIAGKQLQLDVPAIYMWQVTFDGLFYGKGAAIGMLLLISVAFLIIPYLRYTLRMEGES